MRKRIVNAIHTVETLTGAAVYIAVDVITHRHHR